MRREDRSGLDVGYTITGGNEADLTTADYIEHFAGDPQTRMIVSYLESVRDPDKFLKAWATAKAAGKPVIVVKLGTSDSGRATAFRHARQSGDRPGLRCREYPGRAQDILTTGINRERAFPGFRNLGASGLHHFAVQMPGRMTEHR